MNRKDCGGLHELAECGYVGLGYAAIVAMALTALTLGSGGIEVFAKPPCSLRFADEMKVLRDRKTRQ